MPLPSLETPPFSPPQPPLFYAATSASRHAATPD